MRCFFYFSNFNKIISLTKNLYILLLFLISSNISAQDEVSANWSVTVNGNEIILSIVEFNNFTVGLDGHWHYILNEEEYVAVQLKQELYELKEQYGNNLSLNEMRKISDMDFGGLESNKGKKIQKKLN